MAQADLERRLVYDGFEAWIVVGKKSLPLFGMERQELTREISAWIPSEAGQRFVVHYRKTGKDKCAYIANLYFDGHKIDSIIHQHKRRLSNIKMVSSVELSPTKVREFIFSPAVLTDDDTYADDPSSTGIGEIKVIFQPVEVTHEHLPTPWQYTELPEMPKIHERLKKVLVHQIKFSEKKTRTLRIRESSSSEWIGNPTTFIFKYRALDVLQANGIAPRLAPPPEATHDIGNGTEVSLENSENSIVEHGTSNVKQEEDDEVDDVDDQIIRTRALLAELEERRNQKRARKETDRSLNKVKKEFVSPFQPGEVIDLTEPDELQPKKRAKTESTS